MKTTYFSLAILALVALGCYSGYSYVHRTAEKMLSECDKISAKHNVQISTVKSLWNEKKNFLMAIENHKNIEEISSSIIRLETYLSWGEDYYADAESELVVLKHRLRNLHEYEKLRLHNIF